MQTAKRVEFRITIYIIYIYIIYIVKVLYTFYFISIVICKQVTV